MKRKHEHKYLGIPTVNYYPRKGGGELIYKGFVFPESTVNERMVDSYKAMNDKPTDDGFKCWAKRNAMYALHILETLIVSGAYIECFFVKFG